MNETNGRLLSLFNAFVCDVYEVLWYTVFILHYPFSLISSTPTINGCALCTRITFESPWIWTQVNKTLINVSLDWCRLFVPKCVHINDKHGVQMNCSNQLYSPHLATGHFDVPMEHYSMQAVVFESVRGVLCTCVHNFSMHIFHLYAQEFKHTEFLSSFALWEVHANRFLCRYLVVVAVDKQKQKLDSH